MDVQSVTGEESLMQDSMVIYFRVDASLQIGSGHVMRCLTLAEALRNEGSECVFLCRQHAGNLIAHIEKRGFKALILSDISGMKAEAQAYDSEPMHASWVGTSWDVDADECRKAIAGNKVDWLVVDHYGLDHRWEVRLRSYVANIMVIDDLADRMHDCDLLLDQNLGRDPFDYKELVPLACTILAGAEYALLRVEFSHRRQFALERRQTPKLQNVLITMGGVDQPNATTSILQALKTCRLQPDCNITVVMGAAAPWLELVKNAAESMPWMTEVLVDTDKMAELMERSDLAIGAAGSTSWERCCLGLPSVVVCLADNQRKVISELQKVKAVETLDLTELLEDHDLLKACIQKITDNFAHYITCAAAVTDGRGLIRVIKKLRGM